MHGNNNTTKCYTLYEHAGEAVIMACNENETYLHSLIILSFLVAHGHTALTTSYPAIHYNPSWDTNYNLFINAAVKKHLTPVLLIYCCSYFSCLWLLIALSYTYIVSEAFQTKSEFHEWLSKQN